MTTPSPEQHTPEEQRKVRRSLIILYSAMFALNAVLFLVFWWANRGK